MELKPVEWLGTTLDDIRSLREGLKIRLGQELLRVQLGLHPINYKPMTTVGSGAYEIRITDKDGIARLIYVAKLHNAIYVLHVFEKKTQSTAQSDINLAKKRYKEAQHG